MAAIYALSSASCLSSRRCVPGFYLPLNPLFPLLHRRSISLPSKPLAVLRKSIRAVAEEETAAPAEEPATDTVVAAATEEEKGATVTFPVSPSDLLTMYFQAEGMMDESAIPVVSKALQGSEGISDVSVRVEEGIATVEGSAVDDFVEICLHSVDKQTPREVARGSLEPGLLKEQESHCYRKIYPESHMKNSCKRDSVNTLPKCLSENAKISHAVSNLEHGIADARVLKTVFSPLKRIFDPIMKSKSLRDSFPAGTQNSGSVFVHPTDIGLKALSEKSILNEISIKEEDIKPGACLIQGGVVPAAISPAHLHGILRLNAENGYPSFEFSIQDPEEVLSAKTWKTDSAFNWVYTFDSSKKKINTSWWTKDNNESLPPLVGQMQVSLYLCSEVRENGSLFNSTLTEFVSYDIARARRNFSVEERSKCCTDSTQAVSSKFVENLLPTAAPERNKSVEYPDSARHGLVSCESKASTSFPWSSKDLHPQHEIAAIVIQVPFNKKESPTDEQGFGWQGNQKASKCSPNDQKKKTKNHMNPAIIEVVIPSGNHSLPNTDEAGPSSLLDRWRFGGGCDCGGWDMSCPIIVFDNQRGDDWISQSTLEFQEPMLLFVPFREARTFYLH